MTIRVLIAEDEQAVRAALTELISSEPELELVGAARDADEAIELAAEHRPDVAIVDVKMPGGGGQRAAREIRTGSPRTRVIALSAYDDRGTVFEMLRAGASGYLVKGVSASEILETIRGAMRGQGALSAQVTGDVIEELADQLEREDRAAAEHRARIERTRSALGAGVITPVFQPVVDLGTGAVVGVEALSRFLANPDRTPDQWFAEAAAVGMAVDLELAAMSACLEQTSHLPPAAYLSVNMSPETLASRRFGEVLEQLQGHRFVVEITEHAAVEDYDALDPAVRRVRDHGGRLAIDDAGSGYASLRHILRLAPEVIKLDISLTRDIDSDQARRALATAMVTFASEIDAEIVAEGIETQDELEALRELGVPFGQGYHLARPTPAVEVPGTIPDLDHS